MVEQQKISYEDDQKSTNLDDKTTIVELKTITEDKEDC
jgi:hypothetical protein